MATFTVREITCKTAINRVHGMPFDWSLNPYRGCRHACVYCYARPTHEYLGMNGADEFQEVIFAKINSPHATRCDLARASWRRDNVVVGTATDPYQQAESKYQLTRGILEAFRDFRNPVSITTKSPMVLRDVDILSDLARNADVTVHFTVTTLDEGLWRKIEPTTSKPSKRLEAVSILREQGIRAGVFLSPILPGLTDAKEQLESVVAAAKQHNASFVFGSVLRLGPGISEYYLPFVEREFPDLQQHYARLYPGRYARTPYAEMIERRLDEIKRRYGFHDKEFAVRRRAPIAENMQLSLFSKAG